LKKNPHLTFTAFDASDRSKVLAYISLIPLSEEVIFQILRGEREETSITPDEIETYDREGEYTLLAEGVVAHPEHPEMISTALRASPTSTSISCLNAAPPLRLVSTRSKSAMALWARPRTRASSKPSAVYLPVRSAICSCRRPTSCVSATWPLRVVSRSRF